MKAAQAAAEAEAAATQIRVQKKPNDDDLEKMFNTHSKVAIDFIPGLDDEYKPVIMPGAFEAALKEGIEKKKRKEREKLEEAGGFVEGDAFLCLNLSLCFFHILMLCLNLI
jgi:hypothetical protein